MAGKAFLDTYAPQYLIALGGGSPIDAAKGMWLFHEHPDTRFEDLRLRFADIRKRTCPVPALGAKCQLIAIPTTSGTGSASAPPRSSSTRPGRAARSMSQDVDPLTRAVGRGEAGR